MSNILVLHRSGRVSSRSLPCRRGPGSVRKEPTSLQLSRLNEILPVVRGLSGQSLESKRLVLARYGYELIERRVPRLCSVGSYYWYPRLGLFRVVVSSSHIDKRKISFPYAFCIQILV